MLNARYAKCSKWVLWDNTSRYGNSNNLRQKTSYNYHFLKIEQWGGKKPSLKKKKKVDGIGTIKRIKKCSSK